MAQKQIEEWKNASDSQMTNLEKAMQGIIKFIEKMVRETSSLNSQFKQMEDRMGEQTQREQSVVVKNGKSSEEKKGRRQPILFLTIKETIISIRN